MNTGGLFDIIFFILFVMLFSCGCNVSNHHTHDDPYAKPPYTNRKKTETVEETLARIDRINQSYREHNRKLELEQRIEKAKICYENNNFIPDYPTETINRAKEIIEAIYYSHTEIVTIEGYNLKIKLARELYKIFNPSFEVGVEITRPDGFKEFTSDPFDIGGSTPGIVPNISIFSEQRKFINCQLNKLKLEDSETSSHLL